MADPAGPSLQPSERRFEEFFVRSAYVELKNYLYNYLERRRAINKVLASEDTERILEVGSGLSPIVTNRDDVIYSELSFRALQSLREVEKMGHYVVADGTRLPFRSGAISHVVCSEVLEHIENDRKAIRELARVLKNEALACITVPHGKFYFAADDRFVHHFRRYSVEEMEEKLAAAGLRLRRTTKVLGPLEKVTMYTLVMGFSAFQRLAGERPAVPGPPSPANKVASAILHPAFKWAHRAYALLARLDAALMPKSVATVLLFEAVKESATQET